LSPEEREAAERWEHAREVTVARDASLLAPPVQAQIRPVAAGRWLVAVDETGFLHVLRSEGGVAWGDANPHLPEGERLRDWSEVRGLGLWIYETTGEPTFTGGWRRASRADLESMGIVLSEEA